MLCSWASLEARERPLLEEEELDRDEGLRSRKSVTRNAPLPSESDPWAWLAGQKEGTVLWMAFKEACSPRWLVSGVSLQRMEMKRMNTSRKDASND